MYKNELNEEKIYYKKKKKPILTILMLSLMLIVTILFSAFLIIDSSNKINKIYQIINAVLIIIITVSFIMSFSKSYFKNKTGTTTITSLLIICTIIFNALYLLNIIKLPTQKYLPDFYNKNLSEVIKWTEKNNIKHEETFEYSDNIKKYNIINQSKKSKTLLKNINNIKFAISNGPDYNKEIILPDMSGWTTDEVIKFTEENYLKNVQIIFEENTNIQNDIIIKQSNIGKIKRNDNLIFTASLGDASTLSEITLKDLKNQKLLKAETYLGKHGIIYELKYEFSDKIERGKIISSEPKKDTIIKPKDKVILTVSKGKEIKIPELKNMTLGEVTKWIIENNLEIEYSDKYDNEIKKGLVITSNYQTGDTVEEETKINIIFSKGKLLMPKFENLESFKIWASTNNIKFEIKEEFNNDIPQNGIIKYSINENDEIKPDETITVYISKGQSINTPNFIGKTKNEIQKECNNLGITCTFTNVKSDKTEGTAINQSVASGTEISKNQSINIEIATKKQSEITQKNKTSNSNNTNKNQTSNNNKTNNTNTNITDNKTYNNIFIKSTWVQSNDPNANCSKIKAGIQEQSSSKVNITCTYKASAEERAKGKIHEESRYQLNKSYSFKEGQTYNFIIVE